MVWFIKNSILSITLTGALLWISYELLKRVRGTDATQKLAASRFSPFFIAIVTIAIFCFVFGTYGLLAAWLVLTVFSIIWLGSWPLRRLKAGKVIAHMRRPKLSKSVILSSLWVNLFFWGFFGPGLWSAAWLAFKTIPKGYLINPNGLAIYLFFVTFCLLSSYLSIFQWPIFRTNGICYQCKFIPWDRVNSYSLSSLSPGVLIVNWQPPVFLYSREQCIPITSGQTDLVKSILDEHSKPQKSLGNV